jgi:hypothetical protein
MNLGQAKVGFAGYFKIEAIKQDGTVREVAPWQKNLILNQGLDLVLGNGTFMSGCSVGSGNSTPVVTQTALDALVANTNNTVSATNGFATTASPPYRWYQVTYQFNAGVAAGNLSEVGFGNWTGSVNILFSRSLIKDSMGNPTTITILSDEILQVTYQCQAATNPGDHAAGTGTVTGFGSVSGTIRPSYNTSGGQAGHPPSFYDNWFGLGVGGGGVGPESGWPPSPTQGCSNFAYDTYTAGTFQRNFTMNYAIDQANFTSGINAVSWGSSWFTWQMALSPAIPKTSSQTISLTFTLTVARS